MTSESFISWWHAIMRQLLSTFPYHTPISCCGRGNHELAFFCRSPIFFNTWRHILSHASTSQLLQKLEVSSCPHRWYCLRRPPLDEFAFELFWPVITLVLTAELRFSFIQMPLIQTCDVHASRPLPDGKIVKMRVFLVPLNWPMLRGILHPSPASSFSVITF